MYDIERKYKELMTIAEGKVPVLQKNDKQIKYQGINDQIYGARRFIAKCEEDERMMLKYRIIESLESAERMSSMLGFINLAIVGLGLYINTIGTVLDISNIHLSKESALGIVGTIGLSVMLYLMLVGNNILRQQKIVKKSRFLLRLFQEWDNDEEL